jgi:endonuclease/exonuclease/phosphatase family metal-dependent hydrolase
VTFFSIIVILTSSFFWASYTPLEPGERQGESAYTQEVAPEKKETIKIMTWNIAFAQGLGSEGTEYTKHPKSYYQEKLTKMAKIIKDNQIDIVLLQEIDWYSSRTYDIDQVRYLCEKSGLYFYSKALSWDMNYLPFPYWPITNQFGRISSGGAIISRFPIEDSSYELFQKPASQPWWYNKFYLFRYSQAAKIRISEKKFWVINHHLEAFDKLNRQLNAKRSIERIRLLHSKQIPVLAFGGDFNAIPQESAPQQYWKANKEDYLPDSTIDIFRSIESHQDTISDREYMLNQKLYLTFPAHLADRRLDYIFVRKEAKVIDRKVIQARDLSDHLPYYIEIKLN